MSGHPDFRNPKTYLNANEQSVILDKIALDAGRDTIVVRARTHAADTITLVTWVHVVVALIARVCRDSLRFADTVVLWPLRLG